MRSNGAWVVVSLSTRRPIKLFPGNGKALEQCHAWVVMECSAKRLDRKKIVVVTLDALVLPKGKDDDDVVER